MSGQPCDWAPPHLLKCDTFLHLLWLLTLLFDLWPLDSGLVLLGKSAVHKSRDNDEPIVFNLPWNLSLNSWHSVLKVWTDNINIINLFDMLGSIQTSQPGGQQCSALISPYKVIEFSLVYLPDICLLNGNQI